MQFQVTLDESLRAGITAARAARNASLPQTVQVPDPDFVAPADDPTAQAPLIDVPNPDLIATDEAYMVWVNEQAARSYAVQHGTVVTTPEPPTGGAAGEVMSVTRKQGLKALLRAGETAIGMAGPVLESDVTNTILAMPETTDAEKVAKYDTLYEFQNAKTWGFDNPFTLRLQAMLSMTDAQKRALFDLAATFTE